MQSFFLSKNLTPFDDTDYQSDVSFLENSTPWKTLRNRSSFQKTFWSENLTQYVFEGADYKSRIIFPENSTPGRKTPKNWQKRGQKC